MAGPLAHAGRRILLVEDNVFNADMLSRRLARLGMAVTVAEDGVRGLDRARSDAPDLILMDVSLPELDGLEVTRLLKADPATSSIPIIVLTAHAMTSDRDSALAAGCNDFDTKPIELPRLVEKMGRLLAEGLQP